MTRLARVAALIGWALVLGHAVDAHAKPRKQADPAAALVASTTKYAIQQWGVDAVVYRARVHRFDGPGSCPVVIGTNGHPWPMPAKDYTYASLDPTCPASTLAVHADVTANNTPDTTE